MRTARLIGRMTRGQRDLLRKQIDVRARERLAGQSKRGGSHAGDVPKLPRAKS
jgi:hypothetical protein